MTVDTDMLQLISPLCTVWSPIKKVLFDEVTFIEHYHMKPSQYAYYKSITGDKSDNVAGLPKFGKKKALQVINNRLKLTSEQVQHVNKNMEIINLAGNHGNAEWDREFEFYKEQLSEEACEAKFTDFIRVCDSNGLYSITSYPSDWHDVFFAKNTMTNIVNKLFGSNK